MDSYLNRKFLFPNFNILLEKEKKVVYIILFYFSLWKALYYFSMHKPQEISNNKMIAIIDKEIYNSDIVHYISEK